MVKIKKKDSHLVVKLFTTKAARPSAQSSTETDLLSVEEETKLILDSLKPTSVTSSEQKDSSESKAAKTLAPSSTETDLLSVEEETKLILDSLQPTSDNSSKQKDSSPSKSTPKKSLESVISILPLDSYTSATSNVDSKMSTSVVNTVILQPDWNCETSQPSDTVLDSKLVDENSESTSTSNTLIFELHDPQFELSKTPPSAHISDSESVDIKPPTHIHPDISDSQSVDTKPFPVRISKASSVSRTTLWRQQLKATNPEKYNELLKKDNERRRIQRQKDKADNSEACELKKIMVRKKNTEQRRLARAKLKAEKMKQSITSSNFIELKDSRESKSTPKKSLESVISILPLDLTTSTTLQMNSKIPTSDLNTVTLPADWNYELTTSSPSDSVLDSTSIDENASTSSSNTITYELYDPQYEITPPSAQISDSESVDLKPFPQQLDFSSTTKTLKTSFVRPYTGSKSSSKDVSRTTLWRRQQREKNPEKYRELLKKDSERKMIQYLKEQADDSEAAKLKREMVRKKNTERRRLARAKLKAEKMEQSELSAKKTSNKHLSRNEYMCEYMRARRHKKTKEQTHDTKIKEEITSVITSVTIKEEIV